MLVADASARVDDDIARCREILREGSKSFHAASLLLPARVRAPASVVYAFCRVADDAVDLVSPAPGPGGPRAPARAPRPRLPRRPARPPRGPRLRRRGGPPRHPAGVPEALLEGFAWDVEGRSYDDLAGVLAYSARVASAVGVMMTLLMGRRDRGVLARACDLGAAMQLTNIARDVGEDARNGRVYLPGAWLREAGVDVDAWRARPPSRPRSAR